MDTFEEFINSLPGPTKDLKFFNLLLGAALILGMIYDTPEKTLELFNSVGMRITPGFDMPTILVLLGIIWAAIIGAEAVYIIEAAFYSIYAIISGIDYTPAFCGKFHVAGEWVYIREGIKLLGIEGSNAFIGLCTHVSRIGNTLVMEGHTIPNAPLSRVPTEIKPDLRARRWGMLGVTLCNIGFLSRKELLTHKEIKKSDVRKEIEKDNDIAHVFDKQEVFDTQDFIAELSGKDASMDLMVQIEDNDGKELANKIKLVTDIEEATMPKKQKGFMDLVFGST